MIREEAYVNQYKAQWEKLEEYIKTIHLKGYSKLSAHELKEYLNLMKGVSHHLAYARTHYPAGPLVQYLNQLAVRANNHLYAVKKSSIKNILEFIIYGFPARFRANKIYISIATLIFLFGSLLSFILVQVDYENAAFFLPQEYIDSAGMQMEDSPWEEDQFFYLSTSVMTNNIKVAIGAFVYGITLGIMTLYILWMNGAMIGALTSVVMHHSSTTLYYWALILPHGVFELTAIFISGGAGLRIAKGILLPGQYRRKDSLIRESKEAVMLMPGVIILLVFAGLIEGFFTPARISPWIKLIFALLTALILIFYLIPKKQK